MDASTPLMAGQQQQMMMKKESVPVASMAESLFNLINSIIGAGVLTLPSAIKNTGYVSGTCGLLVFAALSSFSLLILEDLTRRKNVASYGSLADALFSGGMGGIVVDVVQSLYSFGSCIGYLSIIVSEVSGRSVPDSVPDLSLSSFLFTSSCCLIFVPIFFNPSFIQFFSLK